MTAVHTRADWGAAPARWASALRLAAVKHIVIHHPGSAGILAGKNVAALLRGWQQYHQKGRGWADIAYNEAVDQAGKVWLLRGDRADGSVKDLGGQVYSILAVLGNGEQPSAAMLAAIRRRVEYHQGRMPAAKVCGHRALRSTSCPGDELAGWIKAGMPAEPSTPEPKPEPKPKPAKLELTGLLDTVTIRRLQEVLGTVADGKISQPSSMVVAELQRRLNAAGARDRYGNRLVVDGSGLRPNTTGRWPATTTRTIWALQRYLGVRPDGYLSKPSDTIRELQKRLNAGKF
ncbi:MAG: N-acetylmuramoyl-L-alanine amidase [Thermomicrobiales bacterium]